jgi:hypothetical protein
MTTRKPKKKPVLTPDEAYALAISIIGAYTSKDRKWPWTPSLDGKVADLYDAMAKELRLYKANRYSPPRSK